jgi:tetratricopeptide (TPR) repeat protein
MKWEKLKIQFKIDFYEKEVVLNSIREQLLSLPGLGWEGPMEAAAYCLENNLNYHEALEWIDISIGRKPFFQNKIIKVKLLSKIGEVEKAKKELEDAIENSTEKELNDYGYVLLNENNLEDALKIFNENIKRYPKSWHCYDSYADALVRANKIDDAQRNYKKALELAPENQKKRIKKLIEKI